MPISLPYTWEETHHDIKITVPTPFNGKSKSKSLQKGIDIYVADLFLKVSYMHTQQLLHLDLAKRIIPNSLKSVYKSGSAGSAGGVEQHFLECHLTKHDSSKGLWGSLIYTNADANAIANQKRNKREFKNHVRQRRNDSISRRTLELQEMQKLNCEKKVEEERATLRDQMALDRAEMKQIDDIKDQQKRSAENEVYQTMSNLDQPTPSVVTHSTDKKDNHLRNCPAPTTSNGKNDNDNNNSNNPKPISTFTSNLPDVRAPAILKFRHTPRIFKTPMRQSTQLREEAFIIKNRPYLKANKYFNSFESSSISSSSLSSDPLHINSHSLAESDPTWLKRKADGFYRAGDYLAAINAYSTIIEKDADRVLVEEAETGEGMDAEKAKDTGIDAGTGPGCFVSIRARAYTNRSACYLQVEEPRLCIHDCTRSIELMDDFDVGSGSSESNSSIDRMRVKILIRMAMAQCQLDTLHDLKLALKHLDSANSIMATNNHNDGTPSDNGNVSALGNSNSSVHNVIKVGIQSLKTTIQAYEHKRAADIAFGNRDLKACIDMYSTAIKIDHFMMKAYSNRSGAYFFIGNYDGCIKDCTVVLETFKQKHQVTVNAGGSFCPGVNLVTFDRIGIPLPGTEARTELVQVCLYRRAAAYSKRNTEGDLDLASNDIGMADNMSTGAM